MADAMPRSAPKGVWLFVGWAVMLAIIIPVMVFVGMLLYGITVSTVLVPVHALQTIHMIWTTQPADMTGAYAFLFRIAMTFVAGWYLILGLVGVLFLVLAIGSSHH